MQVRAEYDKRIAQMAAQERERAKSSEASKAADLEAEKGRMQQLREMLTALDAIHMSQFYCLSSRLQLSFNSFIYHLEFTFSFCRP